MRLQRDRFDDEAAMLVVLGVILLAIVGLIVGAVVSPW